MSDRAVLFVDDEQGVLNALKRLLRKEDYRVLTAQSGRQGLTLLENHNVQVIVSDQRMPEMTGTEFLKQAKDMYPETVRVVLSGYADLGSVLDAINKGEVYRFLTKPWNDKELTLSLRQCLEEYELRQQNRLMMARIEQQNRELERLQQLSVDTLRMSQTLLEDLPVPMIGVSADGMAVLTNRAVHTQFPELTQDVIGKNLSEMLPADFVKTMEHCQAKPGELMETQTTIADRRVNVRIKALLDGDTMRGCILLFG